jgi:hypothetical protein
MLVRLAHSSVHKIRDNADRIKESSESGTKQFGTSGFRRDTEGNCDLLGYKAASSGNPLPTFRYNVSVPSPRVKKSNQLTKGLTKSGDLRKAQVDVP